MKQITYADRELLLQTFESLKDEWTGSDETLLTEAGEWAKCVEPRFGFEHGLLRDVTLLSHYLVEPINNGDAAELARSGLKYVLQADVKGPPGLADFGFLDEAFIASFAVHEIQTRIGDSAIYNPPRLTPQERTQAESLFLKFVDNPIDEDFQLVVAAERVGEGLSNIAACGLFRRLQKNIEFLIDVLGEWDRSPEHHLYARGALSYIVCEDDVIDDRLGIIGYLDDNFVAELAVDLIEPSREPWLDLLDATVGIWPFLNRLIFDDGTGGRPLSEYMIINSALSSLDLRGSDSGSSLVVVPASGPAPFVIGYVAALGLIQDAVRTGSTKTAFRVGQKVFIDFEAVRIFGGIETQEDGREVFYLEKQERRRGDSQPQTFRRIPMPKSELYRLSPAPAAATTRGEFTRIIERSESSVSALEVLFNAFEALPTHNIGKQVLIVTPTTAANELARKLHLHGHQLKDVLPMGHLVNNQVRPWSSRWQRQEPLLLFASDLDVACVYAEGARDRIALVVIDAEGQNASRTASLQEIRNLMLRTLVVSPERTASDLPITNDPEVDLWEWESEDFSALLWPHQQQSDEYGPIGLHERKLQRLSGNSTALTTIAFPIAEEVFNAVNDLRSVARQRGEDSIAELDEVVSLAFGLMSRLMRLATSLVEGSPTYVEIEGAVKRIADLRRGSLYLTDDEREATEKAEMLLTQLIGSLRTENLKAARLSEMVADAPNVAIICPDRRLLPDLENAFSENDARILSAYGDHSEQELENAIIPGWFGKDRMSNLLVPPVTQPLSLLLYDIEAGWYKQFLNRRQASRAARSRRSGRSALFPTIQGWSEPEAVSQPVEGAGESSLGALEAIQAHVRSTYRQRAYRAAQSDGGEAEVAARLVVFDGDMFAFLREEYKAQTVTHLLDVIVDDDKDEKVDLIRKTVKELKLGEALLFHRRSDRDIIRMAADDELPQGMREAATLWQEALISYVEREAIRPQELQKRLKTAGCSVTQVTVRQWLKREERIAPREYSEFVPIIAILTKDEQLNSRLEESLASIREVYGAHQRASHKLAKQVMRRAVEILREHNSRSQLIEIESDVVLVRVVDIDAESTNVRVSIANRLQDLDQWHE